MQFTLCLRFIVHGTGLEGTSEEQESNLKICHRTDSGKDTPITGSCDHYQRLIPSSLSCFASALAAMEPSKSVAMSASLVRGCLCLSKIHGEELPNSVQMLGIQRHYRSSPASAYSDDFGNNRWSSSLRTMLSECDISDE